MMIRTLALLMAIFLMTVVPRAVVAEVTTQQIDPLGWPALTPECRPWARWWWLGSAVDPPNLTRLLTMYRDAGFGGMEICPIYGARGYEGRYVEFLSPRWMEMLAHTTREAQRLGIGIDMTTGTGWPFGGPDVAAEHASSKLVLKSYDMAGGATLNEKLPDGMVQCLRAFGGDGQQIDLQRQVHEGKLAWTAPSGSWRIYAVVALAPIQKVKRAAPGGAGNVLDPYSPAAMETYLARFDRALARFNAPMPRSQFHDSFEYYGANWTTGFFDAFQARRGYDLHAQLPALFDEGPADTIARVKCDYRQTIAELHLAYIQRWTQWCHAHGSLSRNQAHGAPGNLVDLYAAADIPETEIFGAVDERNIPMHKFASSAAHLTGRKLASAESFTWLGEHFCVPLADLKPAADLLFLSGINHLIYHGVPYSPQDVPWPGWLFYAAVNFGPQGGLWPHLQPFNEYIARCQSILQSTRPDNDVLLYWPVDDVWQSPAELLVPFSVHDQPKWLWSQPFHAAAMDLFKRGYGFDAISDHFILNATCEDGMLKVSGNTFRAIVIPQCQVMPEQTLQKLLELARAGATVIVQHSLPGDVPGMGDLANRRAQLRALAAEAEKAGIIVGADVSTMLIKTGARREPMVEWGLRCLRCAGAHGTDYFIVNHTERAIAGWVPLGTRAAAAAILNPMAPEQAGMAATRIDDTDRLTSVYLQLEAGASLILRTFTSADAIGHANPWPYYEPSGAVQQIAGKWRVHFLEGGPALPGDCDTFELVSWTGFAKEAESFAGTARYSIEFTHESNDADDWLLDLGRVAESARVRLNGRDAGILWCSPFKIQVGKLLRPGNNSLEVEVTNLAANRIADLDRRGVNWKAFHEINFVNRDYKPFDASKWKLRDSGLLGPVRLTRLRRLTSASLRG